MAESIPKGAEWPTQVDIPENDEREETPKQIETDEQENAHNHAVMAKEIIEMISQEVAMVHAATLSYLKEYFDGFKMLRERLIQANVLKNYGSNSQLTFFVVMQKNGGIALLLQTVLMACFLPEYINYQKLLMNRYVDMLKKEIHEFISAQDYKNIDELMNASLEREQKTKKHEQSPPKRRIKHGGSSSKKFKSNETYPRFEGKGYP
nr:reverse transcriptase domain-containing protein [Tanacetum cinerariifolium]